MSRYTEMTDEQYFAAQDEFIEKYRAPQWEPIEVLDLILRKENAEEILSGEKKVEVRKCSDFYLNRLTDKKVDKWMTEHRDDADMDMKAFDEFMCATRPVLKIHFHDYNKSWFLDVKCTENALIGLPMRFTTCIWMPQCSMERLWKEKMQNNSQVLYGCITK